MSEQLTNHLSYPWYEVVTGDDLEQGDVLERCPIFLPSLDLAGGQLPKATFRWEQRDVIILSQSCDLVKGREKVTDVLLGLLWLRSDLKGHWATTKGLEDIRRGNIPSGHMLGACDLPNMERDIRVVDFRKIHALPVSFLRQHTATMGVRLRLLPPYREHLSQAFARFFMRVGLPVDIPPFR